MLDRLYENKATLTFFVGVGLTLLAAWCVHPTLGIFACGVYLMALAVLVELGKG
jgi:hypothetical protein